MQQVDLTKYSHGGGCGCKISPEYLDRILSFNLTPSGDDIRKPLVGSDTRDDAAIYDLGDGKGLLCTTDFFMPIVDDPFNFGEIAAANALSDVYAMGGTPISALAVLGWPVKELPVDIAQTVLKGASSMCREAGIAIAGGHSIDNPEPVFGLAVNGLIDLDCVKRNNTAKEGDLLFLTKPLGIGILSTAGKKGVLKEDDRQRALSIMLSLNKVGARFGRCKGVNAMTDVTGFGLLGHLCEMCGANDLRARVFFEKVPRLPNLEYYLGQGCATGGSIRNWKSYGHKVEAQGEFQRHLLSDPQTNGGLLIAVAADGAAEFDALVKELGIGDSTSLIGRFEKQSGSSIQVIVA
ncbi:MAG TPA: selenide, water dikinase SelD [Blastocatellia bacterium]|nr:selenide, water dikinase SelD [Blastocatellia bacterium]